MIFETHPSLIAAAGNGTITLGCCAIAVGSTARRSHSLSIRVQEKAEVPLPAFTRTHAGRSAALRRAGIGVSSITVCALLTKSSFAGG
jgi:hypothetical protein